MEIRELKALARNRAADTRFDARRLALLYTGGSVGLSFVITLISFLLDGHMAGTGGLGGMGTRAILSAAQTVAMLLGMAVLPFWNVGYTRAALDTARGGDPRPATLLEGFRLFLPGLRLFALQAVLIGVLVTAAINAGSILYMLSPAAEAGMVILEEMLKGGEAALQDPAAMDTLISIFWPMYVLIAVAVLAVLIPVCYRLRLTEFSLADGKEKALENMARSNSLMRGNCLWMFRLDLSFWWYFLLQGLAAVLAYGDVIFGGGDVAYWVFYLTSAAAQLALGWAFLPRVQTAYALAYEKITKTETNGQAS